MVERSAFTDAKIKPELLAKLEKRQRVSTKAMQHR